jgi:hypothetical protein
MTKPTFSRFVEAAISVAVSLFAFWWTVSQLRQYHDGSRLDRLGAFAVVLCVTTALAVSWGWLVSLFARSLDWEPAGCRVAALLVLIPAFFIVADSNHLRLLTLLTYLMCFSTLAAGRLAFPGKSDSELREPSKPLTLT